MIHTLIITNKIDTEILQQFHSTEVKHCISDQKKPRTLKMSESSLKTATLDTMNGLLSPDQNIRKQAEEQVKALEVTDDFGVCLTELGKEIDIDSL